MTPSERSELLMLMNERQIRMAQDVEAILAQTKITNGRVTMLENIWFAFTIATPLIGAAIGFIVSYLMKQ